MLFVFFNFTNVLIPLIMIHFCQGFKSMVLKIMSCYGLLTIHLIDHKLLPLSVAYLLLQVLILEFSKDQS